ncbi:MAG: hypothetical protein LBR64_05070 [Dysgonamonadaceae bacterium]|jgi:hypothetical protein|nr:hypothetical protein [Dysgonamonadaceae bacterium]
MIPNLKTHKQYAILIVGFVLLFLCIGCHQQHNDEQRIVRYYIYNYYEDNWLIVRNAVVIKEEVINDSISILQITNHNRKIINEFGITVFYDKQVYQKTTDNGIYFSEDGRDYYFFFDFIFGKQREVNFPVYYFFGKEKRKIELDTIKNYLKEGGEFYLNDTIKDSKDEIASTTDYRITYQPLKIYNDYLSYLVYIYEREDDTDYKDVCQILFNKKLHVPFFCVNVVQQDYYLLSDIIGIKESDRYINEAYEAVMNDKLRLFTEPFSKEVSFPLSWWYEMKKDTEQ